MNPSQLKELIGRIDQLLGGNTWQNPMLPRPTGPDLSRLPNFGQVFPPFMKARRDAVNQFASATRGSDSFMDGMKQQISGLNGQIGKLQDLIKSGKVDKDQMPIVQMELQELMQQRRQMIEMMTSLSRTQHEERMSVIRNLRL